MELHQVRRGSGKPLVLIHGLGSSWRTWSTIIEPLAAEREVIAIDLPGFGGTPKLAGLSNIETLADAVTAFMDAQSLCRADVVGSSMGARLVLELARRGTVGAAVALAPGGFWTRRERVIFGGSVALSVKLVRRLQPILPVLTGNPVGRALLFAQFSARPWRLPSELALTELRSFAHSPAFDEVLDALAHGPDQQGSATTERPVTIGWGRQDLVCLPRQARRALRRFPTARLHWFDACGHFPHWDRPGETTKLILEATGHL